MCTGCAGRKRQSHFRSVPIPTEVATHFSIGYTLTVKDVQIVLLQDSQDSMSIENIYSTMPLDEDQKAAGQGNDS